MEVGDRRSRVLLVGPATPRGQGRPDSLVGLAQRVHRAVMVWSGSGQRHTIGLRVVGWVGWVGRPAEVVAATDVAVTVVAVAAAARANGIVAAALLLPLFLPLSLVLLSLHTYERSVSFLLGNACEVRT